MLAVVVLYSPLLHFKYSAMEDKKNLGLKQFSYEEFITPSLPSLYLEGSSLLEISHNSHSFPSSFGSVNTTSD